MTKSDAQLDLKTTAELLDLPEQAVLRWARIGALPCNGSTSENPVFARDDVLDWARHMGMRLPRGSEPGTRGAEAEALAQALRKGCVLDSIGGSNPFEVLQSAVRALPDLEDLGLREIGREELTTELVKREKLAPTAIGHGFAVPHGRKPLGPKLRECCVVVVRLRAPVEWEALDHEPVDTLLLVLSNKLEAQLELLRRIAFAMRDASVRTMFRTSSLAEICDTIEGIREA